MRWRITIVFWMISLSLLMGQKDLDFIKLEGEKVHLHTIEQGQTWYAISKMYAISVEDLMAANQEKDHGLQIGDTLKIPKSDINKRVLKDNPPVWEEGKLVHRVRTGETVFGIAQQHGLTVEELTEQNPQVKSGLKVGMVLNIQPKITAETNEEVILPALPENFVIHEVQQKESLYGLSKQYNIPIDSIVQLNPQLVNGLKVGMNLYLPKPKTEEIFNDSLIFPPVIHKDFYRIALLLPFDLASADTLMEEMKIRSKEPQWRKPTLYSLEYYLGFMMGLEEYRSKGISFKVFAMDVGKDPQESKSLIQSGRLNDMDMIIGPFYPTPFEIISEFAQEQGSIVFSPVDQPNKILLEKPNVFETIPSQYTQIDNLVDKLTLQSDSTTFIIVYEDEVRSRIIEEQMRKRFQKVGCVSQSILVNPTSSFQPKFEHDQNPEFLKVKNKLDTSTANALILASVNTGFVVPFFNLMDNLDTSEIDVNLYGLNKLYASDQISNYYRHRYKLSLVVNHHVNMNDPKVQWFVSEFERQNGFLPSVSGYAMKGFDLSSFIGQAIQKLGKSFSDQRIQQETFKGLDSIFKFKKVNPSSGFENRGLFFIQYNDYSIVELNMFTPQN